MHQRKNLKIESIALLPYQRIGQLLNGDDPSADMDFIKHQEDCLKGLSPATIYLENKCNKPLIKFSYFISPVCPISPEPIYSHLNNLLLPNKNLLIFPFLSLQKYKNIFIDFLIQILNHL